MHKIEPAAQLFEQVYDAILNAICDGTFLPNARITQEGLAEMLGVSRQPILQVIQLLKRQGFIADAGRKGVMVTPLEPHKLVDLYQIRAALDGLAARQAAKRITSFKNKDHEATGMALIVEGRRLQAGGSMAERISADMNFHQFIYHLSGNQMIAETTAMHWHHIRRTMGAILQSDVRPGDQVWDEHEAIYAAILDGDADKADALARQHAESAAEHLAIVLMSDEYASKRQQA